MRKITSETEDTMNRITLNRFYSKPAAALALLMVVIQTGFAAQDVRPNRRVPTTSAPPAQPVFSERPTEKEISKAWIFEEPLAPLGPTSETENRALASAIMSFVGRGAPDDVGSISEFLDQHPNSAWKPSLLCNLGIVYYRSGYFSLALAAWEESWRLAKTATGMIGRAVADRSAGELTKMNARLGRFEALEPMFSELEGRDVRGPATERILGAKEGYWLMKNHPEVAFRCGPAALERIFLFKNPKRSHNQAIADYPSTNKGVSLLEVGNLAGRAGLDMRLAKRKSGTKILMPAVVHWKVGHYAALLERVGDFYHIQDPTFGDDLWISGKALEHEASGYFVVPDQDLPEGWTAVREQEAKGVWGKGYANSSDGKSNTPGDEAAGGANPGCGGSGPGVGMPVYRFHLMLASLNVWDIPLGYSPPRGPAVNFKITYSHREAYQPSIFSYSNLGNKWTLDWLSYVTDNPGVASADVDLFVQGGGTESYTNYNTTTSSFIPQKNSQAVLIRTSSSPIKYERRMPNGAREFFELSNGAGSYPRKVFLTRITDPIGQSLNFTYDAALRLVAVTDAIGQVTTLVYGLPADTLKVTQVTDPFGRTATLEYNGSGQLVEVTDVAGMSSQFQYGSSDFIKSLITPYGTTSFEAGDGTGVKRWVQATDPIGLKERVEFRLFSPMVVDTPLAPTGMITAPTMLWHEPSSTFWDKKAMAENPNSHESGVMYQWLRSPSISMASNVYASFKKPLESRVWFEYQNQWSSMQLGYNSLARPTKIGRVLDDSSTQLYSYEYNGIGNTTKATDPSGRITSYTYDSTGIDLVSIRQKRGALNNLLDTITYNTKHQPLTMKNASGQRTVFAYDSLGQLLSATNPKGETTTYLYDSLGYLRKTTGHVTGDTTVFTYDGYGRVERVTDREGYAIVRQYDSLDRVTRIYFPDSTYEEFNYHWLDIEKSRDRLGRWTKTIHNANRQPVVVQDPEGKVTNMDWCGCGQLLTLTDPRGKVTRWNRDFQGRVSSKVYDDGKSTQYTYENEGGRIKSVTDAKGQVTEYQYFKDNNLKQVSYSNAENVTPTVSYTYDTLYNRVTAMVDGIGTTSYGYYPVTIPASLGAGRLRKIDGPWSNDTVTFAYDSLGRVSTQAINGVVDSLDYDSLGRVTRNVNALGQFTYSYVGSSGRLDTVFYPNGQKILYSYFGVADDLRLGQIKNLGPANQKISKFSYTYDAEGQIQSWTQQTDSSTANIHNFTYDKTNQLLGDVIKSAAFGNPVLKHYAYQYDKGGNRIGHQEDSLSHAYTVNGVNQLTSVTASGALRVKGGMSEAGTLTVDGQAAIVSGNNSFDGVFATALGQDTLTLVATDYSSNSRTAKYRVSKLGASQGFKYDDNGNMSGDRYEADGDSVAGSRTFEWDALDRLVAIVDGSKRTEFRYDGIDRRVQIIEFSGGVVASKKSYLWVGNTISEERDSTGSAISKRFYWGGYATSSASYFYSKDHLGSIREVLDSLGAVVARYEYDPYGNRTKVSGTEDATFGYTGHFFHDLSRLHLTMYRAYNSDIGEWISRDPIEEDGGQNLYGYVSNNPTNDWDEDGLVPANKNPFGRPEGGASGGGGGCGWGWGRGGGSGGVGRGSPGGSSNKPGSSPGQPTRAEPNASPRPGGNPPKVDPPKVNPNPPKPGSESTPKTNPDAYDSVKGKSAKKNKETGEYWEKDKFHKNHYEVYKNKKDYEKGERSRSVWDDGRPKDSFK